MKINNMVESSEKTDSLCKNNFKRIEHKLSSINLKFIKSVKNFINRYKYLLKPFLIILIINLVAIYPIFSQNINYLDDMNRVMSGTRGWDNFSRYISNFLSIFIHTSKMLTDISPLPQLIAIVINSLSCTLLLYIFKKDKKITIVNIIATLPLSIFPYYLECMSYKYDSPYMALSILFCIIPFLFYRNKKGKRICFVIITALCTIGMCTSYQASSGILIMVALFLAFKEWNIKDSGIICDKSDEKRFKKVVIFILCTIGGYLIGLLIFKFFIMKSIDTYVSNKIYPLKELIPGFLGNLKTYYGIVRKDFRRLWKILILLIALIFIIQQTVRSCQKKILSLILSAFLLVIGVLYAFGIYPFFTEILTAPRAMYGLGAVIALITINVSDTKWSISIGKIAVIALGWCFFTLCFTYGNALATQQSYIDFRIENVIEGLNSMEIMTNDNVKSVKIEGSIGKSPQINAVNPQYSSIINRLVQHSFAGSWTWDYIYFAKYFGLKNVTITKDECTFEDKLEVYSDTMYYTIKTNNEDYILITLK